MCRQQLSAHQFSGEFSKTCHSYRERGCSSEDINRYSSTRQRWEVNVYDINEFEQVAPADLGRICAVRDARAACIVEALASATTAPPPSMDDTASSEMAGPPLSVEGAPPHPSTDIMSRNVNGPPPSVESVTGVKISYRYMIRCAHITLCLFFGVFFRFECGDVAQSTELRKNYSMRIVKAFGSVDCYKCLFA